MYVFILVEYKWSLITFNKRKKKGNYQHAKLRYVLMFLILHWKGRYKGLNFGFGSLLEIFKLKFIS